MATFGLEIRACLHTSSPESEHAVARHRLVDALRRVLGNDVRHVEREILRAFVPGDMDVAPGLNEAGSRREDERRTARIIGFVERDRACLDGNDGRTGMAVPAAKPSRCKVTVYVTMSETPFDLS